MTALLTAPTTMVVTYLKQWMFDPNNPRHALLPKPQFSGPADRNYNLKNSRTKKFLQYEEQTWGINLGWTDNAAATDCEEGLALVHLAEGHRSDPDQVRGADRPRLRDQPVVRPLRGADGRHQPRLVGLPRLRMEAPRRQGRPTRELRRLVGDLQPEGGRLSHLLRPVRGWRHRVARQPDVDRPARRHPHRRRQGPLEGSRRAAARSLMLRDEP